METTIHIFGPNSILKGDWPMDAVYLATSYVVEGSEWSKAFRKGVWDGRKGLLNKRTGAFPTGLLSIVKDACEKEGYKVSIEDHRVRPKPGKKGFELEGISMTGKYAYQLEACEKAIQQMQGIIKAATNAGKCLGPDVEVLMYDGSIKKAREVNNGDLLMGPDSNPRKVLGTCADVGQMYRIVPNKGESWTCNDVHILTLVHTVTGKLIDIPLNEYLLKTNHFKHCHKLVKPENGVEYAVTSNHSVDPYFIGLWLGDGTKDLSTVQITNVDSEVIQYLESFTLECNGILSMCSSKDRTPTYTVTKAPVLLKTMRSLFEEIRIPREYLISSRTNRLKLLAGLIDSDGYHARGNFEIIQKRKLLAEDIAFLARSLGYRALVTEKIVKQFDPAGVSYWRVSIVGTHTSEIPTKIPRKMAGKRKHKWNPLRTGFKVEAIGEGQYNGWTLDGDGRFLLADLTITHNTEIASAIMQYLDLKTLFLVPSAELMYQSRKRFMKRLNLTDKEVGVIGDGEWDPGSKITVAIVDTLESRLKTKTCIEFMNTIDVLFLDECHGAGSDTYYTVATLCPAYYRFGLSATPLDRTDGADLRLLATCGDIFYEISNKTLVDLGVSARADIIFDKITEPVIPKKTAYATVYKTAQVENPLLIEKIVEWTKEFVALDLQVLIMVEEISHGNLIDDALWNSTGGVFIPHQFIHGSESTDVRAKAIEDFDSRNLPVLICSRILDQGVDTNAIDALILAGSRKSKIKTMQRLGRGLRGERLIVIEFANYCHKYLIEHSLKRLKDYVKEGCFPVSQYVGQDKSELIQKLWKEQGEARAKL